MLLEKTSTAWCIEVIALLVFAVPLRSSGDESGNGTASTEPNTGSSEPGETATTGDLSETDKNSPATPPLQEGDEAADSPVEQTFVGVELPNETLPPSSSSEDAASPPPVTDHVPESNGSSPENSSSVSEPATTPASSEQTFRQPVLMGAEPSWKEKMVFPRLTVSPEVGYIFFAKSEMEIRGFKATVEPRNGLVIKLHLDMGGDGFAFEFAPIFALEVGGINTDAGGFADVSGFARGIKNNFRAVGGETTLVYRFSIKNFFPHIGFGFHGTYLMGKDITYGTELYGRIPVGLTVYVAKHVGVVAELGFMYGVTGIRTPLKLDGVLGTMPSDLQASLNQVSSQAEFEAWYSANQAEVDQWIIDSEASLPEGYDQEQMARDMVSQELGETLRFGRGFGLDFVVGVRFP